MCGGGGGGEGEGVNDLVSAFWSTSNKTLSGSPHSGLEGGSLQPISVDTSGILICTSSKVAMLNRPFYSCVLGCLALE